MIFLVSNILRSRHFGIGLAQVISATVLYVKKDNPLSDKDSPGSHEKILREILDYCVEHPDAKDTPEAILSGGTKRESEWRKPDVQKALDFLTSKGWLTKRKTVLSKEIYGINKDRLQEIRNFSCGLATLTE